MSRPVACCEKVSKRYRLRPKSLREAVPSPLVWLRGRGARPRGDLWALSEVSFSVRKGEALGIIGANGAGKSTLLKLLAGITHPTAGRIEVGGALCPLIEVGAGFHPDLTGRENVFLNGSILGMTRREIEAKYEEIVAFAGLEGFMDTPVKRYSSGMYMRLAFSISAQMQPDILLVDEVLAVGDYAFQQRCLEWMAAYRQERGTVIFVSHNLEAVRRLCDRALLLEGGRVIFDGPAEEAIGAYHARLSARRVEASQIDKDNNLETRAATGEAHIRRVWLADAAGRPLHAAASGQEVSVCCEVEFLAPVEEPVFGFFIAGRGGVVVYDTNTLQRRLATGSFRAGEVARVRWSQKLPLAEGTYQLSLGVTRGDLKAYCCWRQGALRFFVKDDSGCEGLVSLDSQIFINEKAIDARG